jgi:hypothetical protein
MPAWLIGAIKKAFCSSDRSLLEDRNSKSVKEIAFSKSDEGLGIGSSDGATGVAWLPGNAPTRELRLEVRNLLSDSGVHSTKPSSNKIKELAILDECLHTAPILLSSQLQCGRSSVMLILLASHSLKFCIPDTASAIMALCVALACCSACICVLCLVHRPCVAQTSTNPSLAAVPKSLLSPCRHTKKCSIGFTLSKILKSSIYVLSIGSDVRAVYVSMLRASNDLRADLRHGG